MFAMTVMCGCRSYSPRGGSIAKDEGFKIIVPRMDARIKQGETRNVAVSLKRGGLFKQDVELRFDVPAGISVEPSSVTVKASDKSEFHLRVSAGKNTAIGKYMISVTGTPKTGNPTSAAFTVKVAAP